MSKEGNYRFLAKNIGLLTLSNFATKLLSFFLVPLYTNILTTAEYGSYDLLYSTIGVLTPILTSSIVDGVFRFTLEPDADHNAIITVCTKKLVTATLVVAVALATNYVLNGIEIFQTYGVYFLVMFFVQACVGIITFYTRGCNRIADLSVSSVIASAVIIAGNIVFMVVFHWGLKGYFLASILGPLVQCVYLFVKLKIWKYIHWGVSYKQLETEILAYSRPFVANSVSWWVNSASDRYVVTWFCGIAENGIYSVAGKIPAILNVLQSIFMQAWSLSAVKSFDPEDSDGFFRNIYAAYNCIIVFGCSCLIIMSKLLSKILYAKEFYEAWRYVPFLTIAIAFGALTGYLGGFFTAVKDSKAFSQSTIAAAVTNIVLNFLLIPWMGALGASLATAICYIVMWAIRLVRSKRYIKLKINICRDILSYGILFIQAIVLLVISETGIKLYCVETILLVVLIALYFKEIQRGAEFICEKMKRFSRR